MSLGDGPFPFIPARHFQASSRKAVDLIVIHSAEAPETPTTAEAVAGFFASADAPVASAHYSVDANSIVQSVLEKDIAFHAAGANANGIGIEHAGFARQTAGQWADAYSEKMLRLSAALTAYLCTKYVVPPVFVSVEGLRARQRGITTHAAVTAAFGHGDHTDPGPNFPMAHYLELVRAAMGQGAAAQGEREDSGVAVAVVAVVGLALAYAWPRK